MKTEDRRKLRNRKRRIERRLVVRQWPDQPRPFFSGSNIHYEMSGRTRAVAAGGVGAIHMMARRVGLVHAIDEAIPLLKRRLPYHESDHVLNIAYNILAGGAGIEDIELLRHDEAYMDMLGAQRIPDPTTAGDFLRRFGEGNILKLMDAINAVRKRVWLELPQESRVLALIDVDGVVTGTTGEKKAGMGLSYKGIWGYHPLLLSLANFREPLYVVNRPGQVPSHAGAPEWIDRAIELCKGTFLKVRLRGDTDFSLTRKLDGWTDEGVGFVFGYDAKPNLNALADEMPEAAYRPLVRAPRHEGASEAREKRENAKERYVKEKGYKNVRLTGESLAEFRYRPVECKREYRMIVLRKNLSVEKGERRLFDEIRYFFYITNERELTAEEVVRQANERCDQENLIEQLKGGINALRVPVHDLISNWAYMVVASLAWTLKAWFGMTLPRGEDREDVVRMEFKRFLNAVMRVPCQVVKGARRIALRILAYTDGVRLLFASLGSTGRLESG